MCVYASAYGSPGQDKLKDKSGNGIEEIIYGTQCRLVFRTDFGSG